MMRKEFAGADKQEENINFNTISYMTTTTSAANHNWISKKEKKKQAAKIQLVKRYCRSSLVITIADMILMLGKLLDG